jgi:hypothetical protein
MAEPLLMSERRMDRLELAISTMAEKLEMPEINKILLGEPLEGAEPDDSIEGSHRYPAAERQAEPGSEVPGVRDSED